MPKSGRGGHAGSSRSASASAASAPSELPGITGAVRTLRSGPKLRIPAVAKPIRQGGRRPKLLTRGARASFPSDREWQKAVKEMRADADVRYEEREKEYEAYLEARAEFDRAHAGTAASSSSSSSTGVKKGKGGKK